MFCSTYFLHYSLLIVIAQRATQFVVVHGWTVFLHPPKSGHLREEWEEKECDSAERMHTIQVHR